MPQKLVTPKRLKFEKIARLTLQEVRYLEDFGLGDQGSNLSWKNNTSIWLKS